MRFGFCVALLSAVLSMHSSVLAQDARDEFMRGAQLYQSEDYEGALEAFRTSYGLAPVPVVLFNIAQCLRYLDRPAEAIAAFHEYLESEESVDNPRREAVEAAMQELEAKLAAVRIIVNVARTEVFIGDRLLGTSPFAGAVYVGEGRQRFRAVREGYLPTERSMTLRAGQNATLRIEMEREPEEGTLVIDSNVPGAVVYVDDRRIGQVPVERTFLAGEHDVMVEADGYRDFDQTVTLRDEERLDVQADLEPRDPIINKWWFWTGVGGAALIAIVTTLIITLPSSPQPLDGSLGTVRALESP